MLDSLENLHMMEKNFIVTSNFKLRKKMLKGMVNEVFQIMAIKSCVPKP
jgi:hypothetical protein